MTERSVNIDLQDLQDIMDDLPEPPAGNEKRKHVLTKDDIIIIARIVQAVSHRSCAMGLEADEIKKIKTFFRVLNGGILAVGYAILAAIGAGIVSAVVWAIKHGVIDIAQSAQKGSGK